VTNEEIYYFRVGRDGTTEPSGTGFALHRTYDAAEELEINVTVRDGDVFIVPRGYHGPCVAAAGYPLYYLNVLAGPGAERSMAFCDDPAHEWVRASWADQLPDPRCPMTSAAGVVSR
jgi:5-deoxy-glucuronate isomerase